MCFPIQLFYRSIGIIRDLSGADEESARDALLRSIYRDDDITKVMFKIPSSHLFTHCSLILQYSNEPVSAHITAATKQTMV